MNYRATSTTVRHIFYHKIGCNLPRTTVMYVQRRQGRVLILYGLGSNILQCVCTTLVLSTADNIREKPTSCP